MRENARRGCERAHRPADPAGTLRDGLGGMEVTIVAPHGPAPRPARPARPPRPDRGRGGLARPGRRGGHRALQRGRRPLPPPARRRPSRASWWRSSRAPRAGTEEPLSWPEVRELATQVPSLAAVAAFDRRGATLRRGDERELLLLTAVSASYFETLGVPAALGRVIGKGADQGLPSPAVLISDRLWRARFGADPALVGRAVQLNDRPFTVIGVLPAGFRGLERGLVNDVWISLDSWSRFYGSPASLERRDARHFEVIARLAPRADPRPGGLRARAPRRALGHRLPGREPGIDAPRAGRGRGGGSRGPARAAPGRGRPPRAGDRRRQRLDPARGPRRRPPRRDGDAAGSRCEPVPHRAPGPGGVRAPRPRRRRRGPPPRRGPRPRGAGAPDAELSRDRLRRRAGPPVPGGRRPSRRSGDARGRRRAGAARLPHRDRAVAPGHGAGARPSAAPGAADGPRRAPGRARGRRAQHRGPPPRHLRRHPVRVPRLRQRTEESSCSSSPWATRRATSAASRPRSSPCASGRAPCRACGTRPT